MGKIKALYHDFDPFKCAVVREAIKAGAITDGEVICGDIKELKASDLVGFQRVHFFCGGGFWDLALNRAGWGDEEVWTGSCPCPSFSEAGKGEGFDDDRHLWPDWDTLIGERRPPVLFGEQSHAAIGFGWLDLVCGNLEAKGYAVAAAVLGAHSVGAPHRRQRLYFAADHCTAASGANTNNSERRSDVAGGYESNRSAAGREQGDGELGAACYVGNPAHSDGWDAGAEREQRSREQRLLEEDCGTGDSADTSDGDRGRRERGKKKGVGKNREWRWRPAIIGPLVALGVDLDAKCQGLEGHFGDVREWRGPGWLDPLTARSVAEAGATRGFWADCDWWYGRDGKYRPIGPGLFPLATRSSARVGRLRMFGDAICVETAVAFIKAYIDAKRMKLA